MKEIKVAIIGEDEYDDIKLNFAIIG